ncbi:MAG: hypothetical protein ACREO3_04075 [Arenimonas sp.]
MIGAALALGTAGTSHARDRNAAQTDARTAQEQADADAKAKTRKGELKQQAVANDRAEARADVRARADINARANADRVEARARVDANDHARVDREQAARAQAAAQARADANNRAQANQASRERARQQAESAARARAIANARHDADRNNAARNQAVQAQERARINRNAPYGQEVSAEAHRRNAERAADRNRNDGRSDDRREAVARERAREEAYRSFLSQRQSLARQRSIDLQRANRLAQYRYQQQYYDRLRQMQLRDARYDWDSDPFFNSAPSYRYYRSGNSYQVNRYGADLLRQAVQMGYQEGYQAGHADRQDGWRPDYRNSFAYQDGNYGYRGVYVDRQEYNHYFREGFQRGYEDGFYRQSRYGRYDNQNGNFSLLETILPLILNLRSL